MVKTTIILKDEIYKQLVKEALEKYGSTRKLSLLINEKLESALRKEGTYKKKSWKTIKLKRRLPPKEIKKLIEEGWKEVIKWNV